MDLQYINIRTQPLYTPIHRIEDMLPAQSNLIHHFAVVGCHSGDAGLGARGGDAEIAFREDYDLLAGNFILFKGFADYFFGAAVGVNISLEASKE